MLPTRLNPVSEPRTYKHKYVSFIRQGWHWYELFADPLVRCLLGSFVWQLITIIIDPKKDNENAKFTPEQ